MALAGKTRTETFEDIEHTVVPVVALVEGVIQCAQCPAPELALASEFGKHVEAWNGRPLTMGHPQEDGQPVSASDPKITEKFGIGTVFNSEIKDDKLVVEAWFNNEKLANNEEATLAVQRIVDGEKVEVSTGYFADSFPAEGVFANEHFEAIQKDIKPDHLAILHEDQTGACSWEDGCGAGRANSSCGLGCDCVSCKDRMTKFMENESNQDYIRKLIGIKDNRISDQDFRVAMNIALQKSGESAFWVLAIFNDAVVYENFMTGQILERKYSTTDDGTITLSDDEPVEVRPITDFVKIQQSNGGNAVTLEERVNALIANEQTQFTDSHREALLQMNEEQLEALEPTEPEPVTEPDLEEGAGETGEGEGSEEPVVEAPVDLSAARKRRKMTAQQYINEAPEGIREVLQDSLHTHNEERAELITALVDNTSCDFTEAELQKMPVANLRKLNTLAGNSDYVGLGGPAAQENTSDVIPPAPKVFENV